MGVDFYSARPSLPLGAPTVAAQLWDVGGGVATLQMAANYVHGCDAIFMFHDLLRRQVRQKATKGRLWRRGHVHQEARGLCGHTNLPR